MKLWFWLFLTAAYGVYAGGSEYVVCEQAMPPAGPTEKWNHVRNQAFSFGTPHHSSNDIIVVFGNDAEILGKFSYGPVGKDIHNEIVELWIDDCNAGLKFLGRVTTNHDGRIAYQISTSSLGVPGQYRVYQRVVADNTYLTTQLRIVSRGTKFAAFDMDGTLTLSNILLFEEIFESLLQSPYVPTPRAGAIDLTHYYWQKGVEVIYLTGRPYVLNNLTRQELKLGGYAPGTLLLTQSMLEMLPTRCNVGEYKVAELDKLLDGGLDIEAAYGNAGSDIFAYLKAGIPKERIYIVGHEGGERGTRALGDNYVRHLRELQERVEL